MVDRRSVLRAGVFMLAGSGALAACASTTGSSSDRLTAQSIVDKANGSLGAFLADPDMSFFRNQTRDVKGMLIVPQVTRGGFFFGGSGGTGVLIARDGRGGWSYPSFHSVGSVTFGLQFGGEISELVLLLMTDNALDAMLSPNFRLGGDVSVAAGPVGAGTKAQLADIVAYSRSKGLYAGFNVEGAGVAAVPDLNEAYYGSGVRPRDILITGSVRNPDADGLRGTLSGL